jgi:Flp pilus assembly protein TadG
MSYANDAGSAQPHANRRGTGLLGFFRKGRTRKLQLRGDDGQALIEFALAAPILMAFVIGFMEFCMAYYTYDAISELAREGTRYAIVRGATCVTSGGSSCTATAAAVNTYVLGQGLLNSSSGSLQVNTTYPDGNESPGSRVKVVVSYVFNFTVPFSSIKPASMSSTSEMYIIQ